MTTAWLVAALAAIFGPLWTWFVGWETDRRRQKTDDDRRWLADRRVLYSRYLSLLKKLEEDSHGIAVFLPRNAEAPAVSDEDRTLIDEMLLEWTMMWQDELLSLDLNDFARPIDSLTIHSRCEQMVM